MANVSDRPLLIEPSPDGDRRAGKKIEVRGRASDKSYTEWLVRMAKSILPKSFQDNAFSFFSPLSNHANAYNRLLKTGFRKNSRPNEKRFIPIHYCDMGEMGDTSIKPIAA